MLNACSKPVRTVSYYDHPQNKFLQFFFAIKKQTSKQIENTKTKEQFQSQKKFSKN